MADTQLAKWGNSLAVRIPKTVAEDAQLRVGEPVTITVAGKGGLVIKRGRRKYRLSQLVSAINTKNRHDETNWGEPKGKEIW